MGYAYDGLIPVAILWKNPGITREEFLKLLKGNSHYGGEFSKYDRWNPISKRRREAKKFQGLYGLQELSEILELSIKETYIKEREKSIKEDNFGIKYGLPEFLSWSAPKQWEISTRLESTLGESTKFGRFDIGRDHFKKGDVFDVAEIWTRAPHWLYAQVEKYVTYDAKQREHVMKLREVKINIREEDFKSFEELVVHYPQFHPDAKYDLTKTSGEFNLGAYSLLNSNTGHFYWRQEQGRYYLDEGKTFENISASYFSKRSMSYGYVDLIMTVEALRHKAFKMLSYRGLQHRERFFKKFSKTQEIYEQAVWNAHTSLSAKQKGMTHTEFLRWRLLPWNAR